MTQRTQKQLSILATVVDDYCRQAGIAVGDPARERLGRQIIELFQSGMDQPDEFVVGPKPSLRRVAW